jgi:hypothetical protein
VWTVFAVLSCCEYTSPVYTFTASERWHPVPTEWGVTLQLCEARRRYRLNRP